MGAPSGANNFMRHGRWTDGRLAAK